MLSTYQNMNILPSIYYFIVNKKAPLPVNITSIYLTQISGNRYHGRV